MTRRNGQRNVQWQNLPLIVVSMPLLVTLHLSLTMNKCPDQDSIYPLIYYFEVSNNLHNKHCGIYWMHMMQHWMEHRVVHLHYSNKHQNPSVKYQLNNMVYLSMKNLTLPKGRARKLMPRFIGPYKVLRMMDESSNVMIELPQELKDKRISPTFHTNLV